MQSVVIEIIAIFWVIYYMNYSSMIVIIKLVIWLIHIIRRISDIITISTND